MKKILLKPAFQLIAGIIIMVSVLTIASCQKNNEPTSAIKNTSTEQNLASEGNQDNNITPSNHVWCFPLYYFKQGLPILNCNWGYGFCFFKIWKCIPIYVEWPPRKWWDIYDLEILREEIIRYGKIPSLTQDVISPKEQLSILPINDQVVMLQLYQQQENMLNEKQLRLDDGFDIPEDLVKQYELKGDHVDAGKYPVIYDARNKTYNALVNVVTTQK